MLTTNRTAAYVNLAIGLCAIALIAASFVIAHRAAAEAVRTYGHNVDSGTYVVVAAVLFVGPAAILFPLAAAGFWFGWRWRWFWQAVAAAGGAFPLLLTIAGSCA
jgi:nitrate reductase gamma subunit